MAGGGSRASGGVGMGGWGGWLSGVEGGIGRRGGGRDATAAVRRRAPWVARVLRGAVLPSWRGRPASRRALSCPAAGGGGGSPARPLPSAGAARVFARLLRGGPPLPPCSVARGLPAGTGDAGGGNRPTTGEAAARRVIPGCASLERHPASDQRVPPRPVPSSVATACGWRAPGDCLLGLIWGAHRARRRRRVRGMHLRAIGARAAPPPSQPGGRRRPRRLSAARPLPPPRPVGGWSTRRHAPHHRRRPA